MHHDLVRPLPLVPIRRVEARRLGIGAIFGWGLWLVSVLLVWALVAPSVAPGVAAVVIVAALVALAAS